MVYFEEQFDENSDKIEFNLMCQFIINAIN